MREVRAAGFFWLKLLYWYTVLGAGVFGLWILFSPATFVKAFGMPTQDPFILGAVGGIWLSFGIVAALGLRSPVAFAPIFLVQLGYKVFWLAGVFLPQAIRGSLPLYAWVFAAIFASYVILDLVAIPFRSLTSS